LDDILKQAILLIGIEFQRPYSMKVRPHLYFVLLCFALAGCSGYHYIPTQQYLTLHKQKGEAVGSFYVLPKGFNTGYSVSDHYYVFASGYSKGIGDPPFTDDSPARPDHSYSSSSSELNFGAGYYWWKKFFHFQISAGGGFGNMTYTHFVDKASGYSFATQAQKSNVFLGPVIAFALDEYFEVGLFSKLKPVHYYHIVSSSSSFPSGPPELSEDDKAFLESTSLNPLFLESGFFFNAGGPIFKANFQLGGVNELTHSPIRYETILFRSGVTLKIRTRRQR
jgi:hypothetical protein